MTENKREQVYALAQSRLGSFIVPDKVEDVFDIGKVVGQGAYSIVRYAEMKTRNVRAAIKFIKVEVGFSQGMNLEKEVKLLHVSGSHENICSFYGLYYDAHMDHFCVATEYMEGGELFDKVVELFDGNRPFTEIQLRGIMGQLISGIDHLHSRNIIHRDIKPENILLSALPPTSVASQSSPFVVKIADFGLATVLKPNEKLNRPVGTAHYMSPERINLEPYDFLSDMWSVGIIMYILIEGQFPFYGEPESELKKHIFDPNTPVYSEAATSLSRDCIEVLTGLLSKNPKYRYSAQRILGSKWMFPLTLQYEKSTGNPISAPYSNNSGEHNALSESTHEGESRPPAVINTKSLRSFNARRKWRAAVKSVIMNNRMKSVLAGLRSTQYIFDLLDYQVSVDKLLRLTNELNGESFVVDKSRFMALVKRHLRIPDDELMENLFRSFCTGDKINICDFALACASQITRTKKEILTFAFRVFDLDNSNSISIEEYKSMFYSILRFQYNIACPSDEWLTIEFNSADLDNSGSIDLDEFIIAAESNSILNRYFEKCSKMLTEHSKESEENLQAVTQNKESFLFFSQRGLLSSKWAKRYAVLTINDTKSTLQLYNDKEAAKKTPEQPKLSVPLDNAHVAYCYKRKSSIMTSLESTSNNTGSSSNLADEDNKIKFTITCADKKSTQYKFRTKNAKELSAWIVLFNSLDTVSVN